jgi:hypothetical protein
MSNFAPSLNSSQNSGLLRKGVLDELFMARFNASPGPQHVDATSSLVFNQGSSDQATVVMEQFGGAPSWTERVGEDDVMDSATPRSGNPITFRHVEYARSMPIPKRFYDDEQYGMVSKSVIDFARKAIVARDKHSFGIYREGFTGTLTADGQALFSNSHVTLSGDTVSNLVSGALADGSLNDAIVALLEQKDQSGEIAGHQASVLLVPPKLFKDACILAETELRPGVANNDLNVYSTKYGIQVVQSQWLGAAAGGSDTAWFLLSPDHSINRWVRQAVETAMIGWEYSKSNAYEYKGMFREVCGAISYEGAVGSTGL